MKRVILSLLTIALALTSAEAAKWRVNNRTGVNANFTTVAAAITAATAGDTIYVEPSATSYDYSVTIDKRLVIIGNGFFDYPAATLVNNPGLQADTNKSVLTYVYFNAGSAGSVMMGMSLSGGYTIVADTSITLRRNAYTQSQLYVDADKVDIRQNLFYYCGISHYYNNTHSNINIQNNLFYYYASISMPSGFSAFIQNNIFDQNSSMNCWASQVNNNIMLSGSSFTANNSVFFNNIGDGTQFPNTGNGSNNLQSITTTALFTNYASGTETRYTLNPTGPGIGAGFNSVDCGIFGGPDPYKLSGIPPFPTIYSLSAPNTTTSSTLPVTISTRSND